MEYQTPILTSNWAGDWEAHSRALTEAMHWFHINSDCRAVAALKDLQRPPVSPP